MQYRKHNFVANFKALTDAKDNLAAWGVLINEINELALDKKIGPKLTTALANSGVQTGQKPTVYQLATWTVKGLFKPAPALRDKIIGLIIERHSTQPFANNGQAPTASGVAASLQKLLADKEITEKDVLKLLANDLKEKQKQRGLKTSFVDRLKNNPVGTGITILAIAGAIYVGCRLYAGKDPLPV